MAHVGEVSRLLYLIVGTQPISLSSRVTCLSAW